jgi:hypothetical protein
MHSNGIQVVSGKGSVMSDVDHTGTLFRNEPGKPGETAGPVTNAGGESAEPAIRNQTSRDEAIQSSQIDIAASQRQNDIFSAKFRDQAGKASRQGGSTSAFYDRLLQFHQSKHSEGNVPLSNQHCAFEQIPGDLERILTHLGNAEPISQCGFQAELDRLTGCHGRSEARGMFRLDCNDFHLRL